MFVLSPDAGRRLLQPKADTEQKASSSTQPLSTVPAEQEEGLAQTEQGSIPTADEQRLIPGRSAPMVPSRKSYQPPILPTTGMSVRFLDVGLLSMT